MLFVTWFTVDGCYWLYWRFKNPVALELMNAPGARRAGRVGELPVDDWVLVDGGPVSLATSAR